MGPCRRQRPCDRPGKESDHRFSFHPAVELDVAGGFPVAQYVGDIVAVDGIRFPTRRRAYLRAPDLKPVRDLLMVAIDFSNFRFTHQRHRDLHR